MSSMDWEQIMITPKLSNDEYSSIVNEHNRRVRRGKIEPCLGHEWARFPHDTDSEPALVCIHCLRTYSPVVDVREQRPAMGFGAYPRRGRSRPV